MRHGAVELPRRNAMPFGDYKTLGAAIRALQVTEIREEFVQLLPLTVSDYFRSKLQTRLNDRPVSCSEWAVCENFIYPVLDEVAQNYSEYITIWSHVSLYQGDRILGTPDYIIAKRSPLSIEVMDMPLAMIMEAKQNDFDMGWGQCPAAIHAAQSRMAFHNVSSTAFPMASFGVSVSFAVRHSPVIRWITL